jgi:hypothetical protein
VETLELHLRRQLEHSKDFFWHRLRWKAISEYLPGDRPFQLVDVGAGAGLIGEFMRRDLPGAVYRFVEPISALESSLEARYTAEANARDWANFAGIDYVALLDVLEHQADDRRFLGQLAEKTAPGTTFLVTVPALTSLWSQWDVALGHHRRYDKESLRRVVEPLPLEVRELNYLFPEMIPLGWLRTLKSRRRRSSEGFEEAFPDLPGVINGALYALGSVSLRLRRWAPAGTSLLAVLVRT